MQPRDFMNLLDQHVQNGIWGMYYLNWHYPIRVYGPGFGQPDSGEYAYVDGIYLHPHPQRIWSKLTLLVRLYGFPHRGRFSSTRTIAELDRKKELSADIFRGALVFWRKRCHREYQHVIAQILQRELEIPGEVAVMISSFV